MERSYIIKTTKEEREKERGKDLPNEREKEKKNLRKGGTDRRRRKLCFIYKWKEIFFINETGKTYQIRRRCLHRDSIRLI